MIRRLSGKIVRQLNFRLFLLSITPIIFTGAVAYASGGGGEVDHGALMKDFGWRVLAFVIMVAFLYWATAKKIKEFFSERSQNIRATIEQKRAEKEETEKKFRDYSAKLDKATDEINNIIDMIKAQGAVEKAKIIEDAKKAAVKMKEDAQTRMEQEFKAARNQLRAEAAQLAVEMAEELLKKNIKQEHHDYMVKDYLDKVVKKH
ncbi:MAG: ATP synthase F0 subunit B [Syntrophaceae bacterium]